LDFCFEILEPVPKTWLIVVPFFFLQLQSHHVALSNYSLRGFSSRKPGQNLRREDSDFPSAEWVEKGRDEHIGGNLYY
jgi:hypothetical protein